MLSEAPDQPSEKPDVATDVPVAAHHPCVLIVEPEALLRWSLTKYLSKWFRVFPTDSASGASKLLTTQIMDAVVVSDELSGRALEDLEHEAMSRNGAARFICTVTNSRGCVLNQHEVSSIEKPFDLAVLANLLGVQTPPSSSAR